MITMNSRSYKKFMSIISMSSIPFMFTVIGDFVFDDSEAIVKNPDVTSESWSEPFFHDFWGSKINTNQSHKSYRPLTILTFRLNYLMNNRHLSATQFKITNLLCHILCSLLVWQTIEKVMAKVKYKPRSENCIDIAYSTALLFGVHPVHSEAVCGIVGRADILAAVTFLLSFISYDKAMERTKYTEIYFLITIVLAGCSMLFKETGFTVLALCSAYEIIVNIKSKPTYHVCQKSVKRITYLSIASVCMLFGRLLVMGGSRPLFKPTDNPAAFSNNIFVKVATYSYIYFLNILLFIWPQWLCYDWSMGCLPLIKTSQDYRISWILLFYGLGFIFVTSIFIVNKKKSTKKMLLIAVALIIIPFLPATNILYPVGFVIAERILYISSLGYCLIICISLNKLIQVKKVRKLALVLFCLVLVIYAARTWRRSKDWQSEYNLFLSGLSVCSLNAKIHYNVAKVADANNKTSWALREYEEAIRLYPEYYQALNNLANLLKNDKKFEDAEMYLKAAISYKQDFPAAWMNLGIVYANTRRYDDALSAYKKALSYRSNYPDCHYNIGNLYLELNKSDSAIKHWYKAIQLKPTHVQGWTNLLSLLDNRGQRDRALQIIPDAVRELPDSPTLHFAVANIYGKMDMYEDAEKHFSIAIALFGSRVQAVHYSNLGVLYHRWKKYDLAEDMYRKALKIDPRSVNIIKNYNKLQKLKMNV